jgi:hypothetical protein
LSGSGTLVEDAYDRGDITFARFGDGCPGCVHARPSGDSFLCAKKEMRVFADSTCIAFEPVDPTDRFVDVAVRRTLYRANLKIEMAIEQHEEVRKRIAAVNAGRVG